MTSKLIIETVRGRSIFKLTSSSGHVYFCVGNSRTFAQLANARKFAKRLS